MKAIIFDTETTDVNEPEVIEAAWVQPDGTEEYCERFLPSKAISLGAMATHHIIPSDLVGCRPSAEFSLPDGLEYMIGHNIDFDWKVAGEPDVKRICTLALSRWLFPQIDSHTQSAMLYHFLPPEEARELCKGAHNALSDVRNCLTVFTSIVEEMRSRGMQINSYAGIYQASEIARVPTVMAFGKHKGTLIKELPWDYVGWLLKQSDIDPYLRKALTSN